MGQQKGRGVVSGGLLAEAPSPKAQVSPTGLKVQPWEPMYQHALQGVGAAPIAAARIVGPDEIKRPRDIPLGARIVGPDEIKKAPKVNELRNFIRSDFSQATSFNTMNTYDRGLGPVK